MRKRNNLFGILLIGILVMSAFVSAIEDPDHESQIEEAKALIESKVRCDDLSDEQLESIGEYYMEQMHPGEEHEAMDERMGGEGSASLRNMHIQMARSMYCGEGGMMGSGMMGSCRMMGGGLMGSQGMMGNKAYNYKSGGMMNMMASSFFGMGFGILGWTFMVLFWGVIIWLVVWIMTRYVQPQKTGKSESAAEILKKRYAKGEITKKQYETMKKEIL